MSDENKCARCGEGPDPDLRTLSMACGYNMSELENIPFTGPVDGDRFYYLLVCKKCRAEWLHAIQSWFRIPIGILIPETPGTGIYVRVLGASIEVSAEDYEEMYPGRVPVKVKP